MRVNVRRCELYGQNVIEAPIKGVLEVFLDEVLSPFYFFQAFSIIIWILEEYYLFAGVIVFLSVLSIGLSIFQIRQIPLQH